MMILTLLKPSYSERNSGEADDIRLGSYSSFNYHQNKPQTDGNKDWELTYKNKKRG